MAASKSQPIANEFKLARSAGHDFAGYPAYWGRCAPGIYPNFLGKTILSVRLAERGPVGEPKSGCRYPPHPIPEGCRIVAGGQERQRRSHRIPGVARIRHGRSGGTTEAHRSGLGGGVLGKTGGGARLDPQTICGRFRGPLPRSGCIPKPRVAEARGYPGNPAPARANPEWVAPGGRCTGYPTASR